MTYLDCLDIYIVQNLLLIENQKLIGLLYIYLYILYIKYNFLYRLYYLNEIVFLLTNFIYWIII